MAGKKVTEVITNVNLKLYPGQLVSLLGANGAGKSTLLRTVAGVQPPLKGNVTVEGTDISRISRRQLSKLVSVVSTDRTMAGGLTVEELVGLGRQPHTGFIGRLDSHDREVVANAMAAVGISHKRQNFVAELSDGERQKAMIARAIAQETPIILLDEPTSFLDVASRVDVLQLLHQLANDHEKAILLSSHDISLSLALSDRLWLMLPDGKIAEGQTEDLVLAGEMSRLFADRNVVFDAAAGDFTAVAETEGKSVNLKCDDPQLSHLIKNALRRNGIAVDANATTSISASSPTEITVRDRHCKTIAEMLSAIKA